MLKLTNLRKAFGELVAVDDLTLEILDGEVFGLLGPNGAGKTTTVSMAVGLLLPDSGQVDVNGEGPPTAPAVRRNIGVDPQSRNAIFDNIEALRVEGRTVVYTTHYMEEAQRLCDRVAIIDQGKLLALDTMMIVVAALMLIGRAGFKVKPNSYGLLAMAAAAGGLAFFAIGVAMFSWTD